MNVLESTLSQAISLFHHGERQGAYEALDTLLSDENQPAREMELNYELVNSLIGHCVNDLIQSDIPLKLRSIEVLAWILSDDFCVCDITKNEKIYTMDSARLFVEELCTTVKNPSEGVVCTALFLISEQTSPNLFNAHSQSLLTSIIACLHSEMSRNIRLYSYKAIVSMIEWKLVDLQSASSALSVCDSVLDWMSDDDKLRASAVELVENFPGEMIPETLCRSVEEQTKPLMASLCSRLGKGGINVKDVAKVWRVWLRCMQGRNIAPVLRLGSTSLSTTGYVLQPFELIYSLDPREGVYCWKSLIETLCADEKWMDKNPKVVKLVLRFLNSVLLHNGLFGSQENEKSAAGYADSIQVDLVFKSLQSLAKCSWPEPKKLLDFCFSSSGMNSDNNRASPTTIGEMLHMLLGKCQWIDDCTGCVGIFRVLEQRVRGNIGSVDDNQWARFLESDIEIILQVGNVVTAFVADLNSERNLSSSTEKTKSSTCTPMSLFEERPQRFNSYHTNGTQLQETVSSVLRLIQNTICSLGRVYRSVSHHQMCPCTRPGTKPCALHKNGWDFLLCRVETGICQLVVSWQSTLVYTGHCLVSMSNGIEGGASRTPTPRKECKENRQSPSSETKSISEDGHTILTFESDGEQEVVLTSATESTTVVVEDILSILLSMWEDVWCGQLGVQMHLQRELILDSFLWFLHRTSAFVCEVGEENVSRLHRIAGGMYGARKYAPRVVIAAQWLLCLCHAGMVDSCIERRCESGDSCNIKEASKCCGILRKGIVRCMRGITESVAIPGLLKWLPYMASTCSESNTTDSLAREMLTPESETESDTTRHVRVGESNLRSIRIHSSGGDIGDSVAALIYTLVGAAIFQLSELSFDDNSTALSQSLRKTMAECIRNLLMAPFALIRKSCFGLQYMCLATNAFLAEPDMNRSFISRGVVIWTRLYKIWLALETSVEHIVEAYGGLGNVVCGTYTCDPLVGSAVTTRKTGIIIAAEILMEASKCMTGVTSNLSFPSSHYNTEVALTLVNVCLMWWSALNSSCISLARRVGSFSDKDIVSIRDSDGYDALKDLTAQQVFGALSKAINICQESLRTSVIDVKPAEKRCVFYSSTGKSESTAESLGLASDASFIQGNGLYVSLVMIFDIVLKLWCIAAQPDTSLDNEVIGNISSEFTLRVVTCLTQFIRVLDDTKTLPHGGQLAEMTSHFTQYCCHLARICGHEEVVRVSNQLVSEARLPDSAAHVDMENINFLGCGLFDFRALCNGFARNVSNASNSDACSEVVRSASPSADDTHIKLNTTLTPTPTSRTAAQLLNRSHVATAPVDTLAEGSLSGKYMQLDGRSVSDNVSLLGKRMQERSTQVVKLTDHIENDFDSVERSKKVRQWDVPITYTSCDRENLAAQSQQHSCSQSLHTLPEERSIHDIELPKESFKQPNTVVSGPVTTDIFDHERKDCVTNRAVEGTEESLTGVTIDVSSRDPEKSNGSNDFTVKLNSVLRCIQHAHSKLDDLNISSGGTDGNRMCSIDVSSTTGTLVESVDDVVANEATALTDDCKSHVEEQLDFVLESCNELMGKLLRMRSSFRKVANLK